MEIRKSAHELKRDARKVCASGAKGWRKVYVTSGCEVYVNSVSSLFLGVIIRVFQNVLSIERNFTRKVRARFAQALVSTLPSFKRSLRRQVG